MCTRAIELKARSSFELCCLNWSSTQVLENSSSSLRVFYWSKLVSRLRLTFGITTILHDCRHQQIFVFVDYLSNMSIFIFKSNLLKCKFSFWKIFLNYINEKKRLQFFWKKKVEECHKSSRYLWRPRRISCRKKGQVFGASLKCKRARLGWKNWRRNKQWGNNILNKMKNYKWINLALQRLPPWKYSASAIQL